jgi:hypothetical protein
MDTRKLTLALASLVTLAAVPAARAESLAVFPPGAASEPAVRYASLDAAACTAELTRRGVSFEAVEGGARGVLAPVRLDGPLNGVSYRTELPERQRTSTPWEVLDCRLALALHDFGTVLQAHDIDEVVIFSAWRPPVASWPEGRIADRHPGAMAIDARKFRKKSSGEWLVVENDWHGRIGIPTCGTAAPPPTVASPAAADLRGIVCEAADRHLFNGILTPNYNRAHFNHFHLEVKANVAWFLVR